MNRFSAELVGIGFAAACILLGTLAGSVTDAPGSKDESIQAEAQAEVLTDLSASTPIVSSPHPPPIYDDREHYLGNRRSLQTWKERGALPK
jgi:hypothetical protein